LTFFSRFFYINAISYVAGTTSLVILVAIVERLLRQRVVRKVGGLEFVG